MGKPVKKRRKIWLKITTGTDEGFLEETRLRASFSKEIGYAPFVELLPGSVVLSSEDVTCILNLVQVNSNTAAATKDPQAAVVAGGMEAAIRTLLRGRR